MKQNPLPTINMLYCNLQYAETTHSQLPDIIKDSYNPVLDELLKRKNTKMLMLLTGRTIEILAEKYPKTLAKFQKLVKRNSVQLVGGTYTNPVLPIIPRISQEKQIKTHLDLVKKYFNVKPNGFALPEYAWDPSLSKLLDSFDFKWTIIPHHLIEYSARSNESAPIKAKRKSYSGDIGAKILEKPIFYKIFSLYPLYRSFQREVSLTDHEPFIIDASIDKIIGLNNNRSWSALINLVMTRKGLQTWTGLKGKIKRQIKYGKGLFFPYFVDIENIGFKGGNSPLNVSVKSFMKYLDLLKKMNIKYTWPDEYLKENKAERKIYVKAGSGEPGTKLSLWTEEPDNQVLNMLCNQIREKIIKEKDNKKAEKAWHYLMLAENGDGRGWNPVPEKRLACFQAAEKALEIFEQN